MTVAVPEIIKKVGDLKLCKVCLRSYIAKRYNGKNCFRCTRKHENPKKKQIVPCLQQENKCQKEQRRSTRTLQHNPSI